MNDERNFAIFDAFFALSRLVAGVKISLHLFGHLEARAIFREFTRVRNLLCALIGSFECRPSM